MGIFEHFKKKQVSHNTIVLTSEKAAKANSEFSKDYTNGSKTDYNTDGETYYTTSDLVNACVNYIAETGALTKLTIGIRGKNGNITEVRDRKLKRLFNVAPNAFTTWSELLEQSIKSFLLTGSTFLSFERLKNYEIWYMPTSVTKIVPDVQEFVAGYLVNDKVSYNTDEMIHIRRGNIYNQHYGTSALIDVLTDYLTLEGNAVDDIKDFYANSSVGEGVLETKYPLDKEQIETLRKQFKSAYGSNSNRHSTIVLPNDIVYKSIKLSPKDSMLLDSLKISESRVLRAFRLNAQVLGGAESFSNNIAEVATMAFNTAVLPIIIRIVEQLELFIRELTNNDNIVIIPSYANIPYINKITESEAKSISQLTSSGILTINEARISLGFPIKTGGAFDINFAPAYLLGGTPIALDTLDTSTLPTSVNPDTGSSGSPPNSVDPKGGSKR